MHEYPLVQALIDDVERHLRDRSGSVRRVRVRLGALSGVEPELFATAYDTFRPHTVRSGATLELTPVPARWSCPQCRRRSWPASACSAAEARRSSCKATTWCSNSSSWRSHERAHRRNSAAGAGVGNPLHRDDGLGLAALSLLTRRWRAPAGVRVLEGGTLGAKLLPWIAQQGR